MYGKLLVKSKIKVLTGLHIGYSNAFSTIGAVDCPLVRDPLTKQPIIPGSSLKGKMRTLLARSDKNSIRLPKHNEDCIEIRRLFGSSEKPTQYSRLQFADAFVSNADEFREIGLVEIKFENTIDRKDSVANPRQIERVVPGVEFTSYITYEITEGSEVAADMELLAKGMKLLQIDYLGGHGTRGSGRISFKDITIVPVESDMGGEELKSLCGRFKEVEEYELLSV